MNSKIILTVAIALLSCASALTQWKVVDAIPLQPINAIHFSGSNIYVGGDTLYISTDKGTTWQKNFYQDGSFINAIINTGDALYAGFNDKGVFKSTDNGATWTEFNTGLSGWGKSAAKFLVWEDKLFYGSNGGGVYYTSLLTPGSWVEYNEGLPWNIAWTITAMCHTNNNLIIGAGASGFYYIRPKGSNEWLEKTIITPDSNSFTPNTLLAIGNTVFAGARAGIYRSMDGGYSWDSVGIKAIPLKVVALTYDGNRIFAGLTRSSDFFVWYSDDMGNTWHSLDHQFNFLIDLYAAENRIWGAVDDGLWYNDLEITGIKEDNVPENFELYQNHPNPFNPSTKISYYLSQQGRVNLTIYDILGREMEVLINEDQQPGKYSINFKAKNLSSGIYISVLQAEGKSKSVKMILLK